MSITEKGRLQQWRRNWNSRLRARRIDGANCRQYGNEAPRFAERLWVPLEQLQYAVKAGNSKQSARIIHSWPADKVVPIEGLQTIRACIQHWRDGVSWEQTGIYDQMMASIREHGKVDRMRTLDDIKQRYQHLDRLYQTVVAAGGLSPREALIKGNFREEGGTLVHIGPDGAPYFGRKGHHRLAMALAAGFAFIPAQLGVVHVDGLAGLADLRQRPTPP
ncbi:MAG: hypothetical protein R3280_16720 [Marinobacter sp.]|uniref:hypothetical protein n=1 Tax=Marinobacter sp. TaxID=50741 RepID=UPI00299D3F86|nr:hypothetical protein [Marinobacter sp.]MDX1636284.1 hypothetical protein [Marinobacter sp.]